jgi:hypothetical protein
MRDFHMNKITDGWLLVLHTFGDGLDVWSSGDGTPGSDTTTGLAVLLCLRIRTFRRCIEIVKPKV